MILSKKNIVLINMMLLFLIFSLGFTNFIFIKRLNSVSSLRNCNFGCNINQYINSNTYLIVSFLMIMSFLGLLAIITKKNVSDKSYIATIVLLIILIGFSYYLFDKIKTFKNELTGECNCTITGIHDIIEINNLLLICGFLVIGIMCFNVFQKKLNSNK